MKISARQYAESLYQAAQGHSKIELSGILKKFAFIIGHNRDQAKLGEIIRIFQTIWSKEEGEIFALLQSARPLERSSSQYLVEYLKEKTAAKKISLLEKIDQSLIGGFILKYNNRIIDGSVASSLDALKNKISN